MSSVDQLKAEYAALIHWGRAVSEAALLFEARWTMAALKRVDPDVHCRLREQRGLFDTALVKGTVIEIEKHGAAMVRGYCRAVQVMEQACEPDDAYMLGQDPQSGLRVAIGEQKAAAARVCEVHGEGMVWLTPDEVATILANTEAFKPVASIKRLFPGAEILNLHQREPANGDGQERAG